MATIVVEVEWPEPLSDEQLEDEDSDLMRCVGERGGRWMRSFVSSDRQRTICLFDAPDAESMREAYRRGGVPHAKVWSAETVEPANAART